MTLRRFPNAVYRHGEEPDPRFSLANERTVLAWILTSLGLIAVGVALEALQLPIRSDFRVYSAGVFIVLGRITPVHAWISWMRTERAMRKHRPLPVPTLSGLLTVRVVVAGRWIRVTVATRTSPEGRPAAKTSAGVFHPRVLRGRWLRRSSTPCSTVRSCTDRSVSLGEVLA